MKTEKQAAIDRCAIWIADRVEHAVATGDRKHTTADSIKKLLEAEFKNLPEGKVIKG